MLEKENIILDGNKFVNSYAAEISDGKLKKCLTTLIKYDIIIV
jgi:hypothetical protein